MLSETVLGTADVAARLGIDRAYVAAMARAGKLQHRRVGRVLLFEAGDIERVVAERRMALQRRLDRLSAA